MADPFRHVRDGEPLKIPAASWNACLDAAKANQAWAAGAGAVRPAGGAAGVIMVRNDSGADRLRFDVLAISSVVFVPASEAARTAFRDQPIALVGVALDGVLPWCILLEPVASGQIGRARIAGEMIALVDIVTEGQKYVTSAAADYRLQSCDSGQYVAEILWSESGTGEKLAVIRIGAGGAADGILPCTVLVDAGGGPGGVEDPPGTWSSCTYTYTVKSFDGTTILKHANGANAAGLTPLKARYPGTAYQYAGENGSTVHASYHRDADGNIVLRECLGELDLSTNCSEEA